MNETSLRELFERVTETEPPIGPVVQRGIRAGIRLRRRRRVQNAVAGVAAIAVVAAAVVATTSIRGGPGGQPAAPGGSGTVYVVGNPTLEPTSGPWPWTVTPIHAATNTLGATIDLSQAAVLGGRPFPAIGALPDGKTIYVSDGLNAVIPISTATGTAGKPIPTSSQAIDSALDIVAAPDGKTVYVLGAYGSLTPISTATNTPGSPLRPHGQDPVGSVAITPDGKTVYVSVSSQSQTGAYVIPISTATDKPGKPIRFAGGVDTILITPDGKTAYVVGGVPTPASGFSDKITVTPITTSTNTVGRTVIAGTAYVENSAVMTPDGQHIYIATANPFSLIQFSTATNSARRQISFGSSEIFALAAAPDGQTVYVASELNNHDYVGCPARGVVTPVATATGRPGKPIQVACTPGALAVTPDGKTVYVASYGSGHGVVTPIAAATDQPGTPIRVDGIPGVMLITP